MYTHTMCTHVHTTVYGCGRDLRGPVGIGWCACDKTNITYTLTLSGWKGSTGCPYIMYGASDPIGYP